MGAGLDVNPRTVSDIIETDLKERRDAGAVHPAYFSARSSIAPGGDEDEEPYAAEGLADALRELTALPMKGGEFLRLLSDDDSGGSSTLGHRLTALGDAAWLHSRKLPEPGSGNPAGAYRRLPSHWTVSPDGAFLLISNDKRTKVCTAVCP